MTTTAVDDCGECGGDGVICGYGFFPGGDPRDFWPDAECCTPEEIAAHKAACERWDAGKPADEGRSGLVLPGVGIVCGHRFGIGTYTIPCACGRNTP